ncbi:unnamed protein product [Ascophyllum nodosum]
MLVIFVAAIQTIPTTMSFMCANETSCPTGFEIVEFVAVVIFTIEYALRIYTDPETYPELSPCVARRRYSASFHICGYPLVGYFPLLPSSPRGLLRIFKVRSLRLIRMLKL